MSIKTIYNDLRNFGMTHAGACAMMGNMQAESSMKSNIVQRGFSEVSDEEFTAAVDSGKLDFINGFYGGYGLCQWTYKPRKRNLLSFAHNWGVSIGAEDMQVAFAVWELQDQYPELWRYLCSTDNMYNAAERICKEFERPAVNNIPDRFHFAQEFEAQFAHAPGNDVNVSLNDIIDRLEKVLNDLKKIGG